MVRRRLGELGLTFTVVTAPHSRPERKAVLEVSGQPLVPVLVVDEKLVLKDENEILDYLEKTYGPVPEEARPAWPDQPGPALARVAESSASHADTLMGMSLEARRRGDLDTANVLESAAKGAREVARWVANRVEEVTPGTAS